MVDHSSPPIHCLVVQHRHAANPIASRLLADAHTLGMTNVIGLEYHDLYFIAGSLQPADLELLATELLSDAALHEYTWRRAGTNNATTRADHSVIESTLRAGVTRPCRGSYCAWCPDVGDRWRQAGCHRATLLCPR